MNTFQVINIFVLPCETLIGLLVTLYSVYLLRCVWNKNWLIQRERTHIVFLFVAVTFQILVLPSHRIYCNLRWGLSSLWPPERRLLHDVISTMAFHATLVCYIGRIFTLYFKHGYQKAIASKDWSLLIHPDLFRSNWFIVNQHRYQNEKYMLRLLLLVWLTQFLVCLGISHTVFHLITGLRLNAMLNVAACVIGCVFGYRWWRSFPIIHDAFYIEEDIKFSLKMLAIVCPLYFVFLGLFLYDQRLYFHDVIYMFGMNMFMYSLVIYPRRLNSRGNDQPQQRFNSRSFSKWTDIISDKNGLEIFMTFLQTEFAAENLLFAVEYMQFMHLISQSAIATTRNLIPLVLSRQQTSLPETFPLSTTMKGFAEEDVRSIQSIQQRLYKKYISEQSMLEINVDYKIKKSLLAMITTQNESEFDERTDEVLCASVMVQLEKAFGQVTRLMDAGFKRFQTSAICKAYEKKRSPGNIILII